MEGITVEHYNQHKGVESIAFVSKLFGVSKTALSLRVGKEPRVTKRYACDQLGCDTKLANAEGLASHLLVKHDINIFKCGFDGCEFIGKNKKNLYKHRKVHDKEKPYACEWPGCDYKSCLATHVTRHRKTHCDIKFRCSWPECTATFNLKSKFKAHVNEHKGYKPFPCPWPECERSFANQKFLNYHLMQHKGECQHQCEWPGCDKRFVLNFNMRKHMKYVHHKPS